MFAPESELNLDLVSLSFQSPCWSIFELLIVFRQFIFLLLYLFPFRSESQLSVELASLGYQRSHIIASSAGYDQQRGGMAAMCMWHLKCF